VKESTEKDRLAERAKALFDASVEDLDAATLSRLNRSRHAALQALHSSSSTMGWLRWLPVTGVVAAAVVTAVVLRAPDVVDAVVEPVTASDFEMLLEGESFEMLEELEFYSWLDVATALDSDGNAG
jgi:hypothetical protein